MKKILVLIFFSLVFFPTVSFARKNLDNSFSFVQDVVPATGVVQEDASTVTGQVIKYTLGAVGTIFFGIMFYAGFLWFTARGNDEKITKARSAIIAAVIGVAVTVSAYGLTNVLFDRLVNNKGGGSSEPSGCCYDWVASDRAGAEELGELTRSLPIVGFDTPRAGQIKTWRITTKSDCKMQGETVGYNGDYWAGAEGEGYWQFFEGKDDQWCSAEFGKAH